jgi:hypothetical protein
MVALLASKSAGNIEESTENHRPIVVRQFHYARFHD